MCLTHVFCMLLHATACSSILKSLLSEALNMHPHDTVFTVAPRLCPASQNSTPKSRWSGMLRAWLGNLGKYHMGLLSKPCDSSSPSRTAEPYYIAKIWLLHAGLLHVHGRPEYWYGMQAHEC